MKKVLKIAGISILVIIGLLVILFITFYISTMGNYEVAKTVEQDPSIPHIKIQNYIFHAETFGNDTNEVVIVLHGGPGNDYRYLLSLKALADDYFVVFYDQRGTGLSPRVDVKEHTIENMINDLNNIIDYYAQGRKVHIIGHSWGAMLASGYIGEYPSKVDKVVLAEPGILTSEKAAEFARNSEVEYLAGDGVGIRWRFVAIGQIQGFDPEELGDGSEILSMFLKNQEAVSMLASFDED